MRIRPRTAHPAGFSLVEVTLAIGITAIALVSIMGMLPKGLETLRRATDRAVMGRIHQQVLGELQLTSWEAEGGGSSPLDAFDGQIRYYDDQGIELEGNEAGGQNHIYTARVTLPRSGSSLPSSVGGGTYKGTVIPGESQVADAYLRLVIVEITGNVDPTFLSNPSTEFDNLNYRNAVYTYRTMIAKMDRTFEADP